MTIIERATQAARIRAAERPAEALKADPQRVTPTPRPAPLPSAPGTMVPFPRFGTGGSLVTEAADRNIYEQFRRLKRPLLQCAFGPLAEAGTQIIMVTSPLQGAGKTFVASNLAYVLALEKDRTVLLVDTDNANPSLTRQIGLSGQPGLYDLIHDAGMTLENVVRRTDVPGLFVLPAGRTVGDSLERLNSARCREVLGQGLANHPGGIIILDSPPLLMTNEAPAVAALAGQFLLVVEAGVTPRSSVSKSLELLDEQKPVGLILNKAPGRGELGGYYGYGYPAQSGSG
jgi:Mrp family chromosome partitioning ATPase